MWVNVAEVCLGHTYSSTDLSARKAPYAKRCCKNADGKRERERERERETEARKFIEHVLGVSVCRGVWWPKVDPCPLYVTCQ